MTKKSRKNKLKKLIYLMSVSAVLAAAAMAAFILTQPRFRSSSEDKSDVTDSSGAPNIVAYDRFVVSEGITQHPVLPTDIENVFLKLSPDGVFSFYQYTDENAMSLYGGAKTIKTTVSCSHQNIPVTIYYIEENGKISGFGLFTTNISDADVRLYEYAFFKIINMPDGYGDDKVMLLVDFDKEDFTKAEKTYSEIFGLDLGSGKTTRLTGDNGRTVDKKGRLRTDWVIMTDGLLQTCGGKRLYLSGRNYGLETTDTKCDLLLINNVSQKPSVVVGGLYGLYLKVTDDGLVYLRQSKGGFSSILNKDGAETVVASLSGEKDNYLLNGDWVLNKTTLELVNLVTGGKAAVGGVVNPTSFSVNPDGTKAVVFKAGRSNQTAALCSLETGAFTVSEGGNIISPGLENVVWVSEGQFITTFAADGGEYCYRLCSF
ncbi:MAG: hypothetical protein GX107_06030 [Clostridiales bacterium]|jgi:hypothetical protein|nr:hypothetical protein [Clostridiales bacterium]